MSKFKPPLVPFVQARRTGGKQRPRAIVLRSSHTTTAEGAALGLANAWHYDNSASLPCHYVVDEAVAYQCTPDRVVSASYPSTGAITVCVCAEPTLDVSHWDDIEHVAALDRAVDLVAQLVLAYQIPIRYLNELEQKRWDHLYRRKPKGLIIRVSGEFPAAQFLANVETQVEFFKLAL